ncbi:hypothetical protein [Lacibacter sp. H407]|uniref:hypothetical protein n=1 Tax=Lacibacter sp. H407 TaxID=3133423 RepID=UPI0030BB9970
MKTNCKPFVLLLLTSLLLHNTGKTQCDVSDVKNPASVINNNSTGSFDWDNATHVYSSNNTHASAGFLLGVLATVHSNFMMLDDFDMSIPAAVTICGIEVRLERKASGLGLLGASVRDHSVMLVKNGGIVGNNKANTSTNWTGSDQTITYGSSSDLWGTSWTSADINGENFGFAFSAELKSGLAGLFLSADVDNVRITVYYQHIILPMAIHNFKVVKKGTTSLLSWDVKDEAGNTTFYIERSSDQRSWITIDSVSAVKNNNAIHSFNFIDKKPLEHVNFYRLKQIDTDGKHHYSAIDRVTHFLNQNELTVSIQPGSKTLELWSPYPIERCIVYHTSGKTVGTFINQHVGNKMLISTEKLPEGLFVFQASSNNQRHSKQILIRK